MDEKMIKAAVNKAIRQRLERTPDGYYITDDGKTLYALLAGEYLWSLDAPTASNFHLMSPEDIAAMIHDALSDQLDK